MDEQISITNPSIEVLRHQAITNIYRALAEVSLTTADDCNDAALALQHLEMLEAEGWAD